MLGIGEMEKTNFLRLMAFGHIADLFFALKRGASTIPDGDTKRRRRLTAARLVGYLSNKRDGFGSPLVSHLLRCSHKFLRFFDFSLSYDVVFAIRVE